MQHGAISYNLEAMKYSTLLQPVLSTCGLIIQLHHKWTVKAPVCVHA